MNNQHSPQNSPVHVMSILVTLAFDWIWSFFEGFVTISLIGLIALPLLALVSGSITFLAVYLIQYFVAHDTGGTAFAKGIGMGVLAAVPYPVVTTAIGAVLLAWAGIKHLNSPSLPREEQHDRLQQ